MNGLARIVATTLIIATTATSANAITRAERERIIYNICCELFSPDCVQRNKRIYYDNNELLYGVYIDDRCAPIIGRAYFGFDGGATEGPEPENSSGIKQNIPAGYYHNSTASDSLAIRNELINEVLPGKVDQYIATLKSTWGTIKRIFK